MSQQTGLCFKQTPSPLPLPTRRPWQVTSVFLSSNGCALPALVWSLGVQGTVRLWLLPLSMCSCCHGHFFFLEGQVVHIPVVLIAKL